MDHDPIFREFSRSTCFPPRYACVALAVRITAPDHSHAHRHVLLDEHRGVMIEEVDIVNADRVAERVVRYLAESPTPSGRVCVLTRNPFALGDDVLRDPSKLAATLTALLHEWRAWAERTKNEPRGGR